MFRIISQPIGCLVLLPVTTLGFTIIRPHLSENPGNAQKPEHANACGHWKYEGTNGPKEWRNCEQWSCGGTRQSPVNIDPEATLPSPGLRFKLHVDLNDSNTEESSEPFNATNTGHNIQINVPSKKHYQLVQDDRKYQLKQVHFHWGSDDSKGSEHTIDGVGKAMELHLVHENLNANVDENFALLVVGVLVEIGNVTNKGLGKIVQLLKKNRLVEPNDMTKLASFTWSHLLPEEIKEGQLHNFYHYRGSLTTPPCSETVDWNVMVKPIKITEDDLNDFRQAQDSEKKRLEHNCRPTQPLGTRVVYRVE